MAAAAATPIAPATTNAIVKSHNMPACSGDGIRGGGAEGRRERRGAASAAMASTAGSLAPGRESDQTDFPGVSSNAV
jgi:hypothetical protein